MSFFAASVLSAGALAGALSALLLVPGPEQAASVATIATANTMLIIFLNLFMINPPN
jgi:multisubunit Na+/H+ antiporter MnhF subunit